MRIFDEKFKANRANYILQSLIATGAILIISLTLDIVLQTTIIASMGATTFITFTMPRTESSRPRYILGGYTIGIISGSLCSVCMNSNAIYMEHLLMATAVGLSVFLMVITNTEHPPAAALAMGLVISGVDIKTILIIYTSLIVLLFFKGILYKWMIDLL